MKYAFEDLITSIWADLFDNLSTDGKLTIWTESNSEKSLKKMAMHQYIQNYRLFINYLRKIQSYISSIKYFNYLNQNSSNSAVIFIIQIDYSKLTLRDWIRYIEVFSFKNSMFREKFNWTIIDII